MILFVICTGALVSAKRQFPRQCELLVDRQSKAIPAMVTKKVYEQQPRYSANGTGKDRLRVVYQNGGNYKHSFELITEIETLLNNTRPHVLYMAENRMDDRTKDRLENRHGFKVETLGENERVWAAVKTTVPYVRRRDCEEKGILPISARKTTTKAKHRVWKKTLLTVDWQSSPGYSLVFE